MNLNTHLSRGICASVIATLALSSCDNKSSDPEPQVNSPPPQAKVEPKPQPKMEEPKPENVALPAPVVIPEPQKETKIEPVPVPAPAAPTAAPTVPTTPTVADNSHSLKDTFSEYWKGAQKRGHDTYDYLTKEMAEAKDLATDQMATATESTKGLITPSAEDRLRDETLEHLHERSMENRDQDLAKASEGLKGTPTTSDYALRATLDSDDEVSSLLTALATEKDQARATEISSLLVDELFNEPEMARAKVMKLQLNLRRLSEANLYNDDVANRVSYLQAVLDERIASNDNAELLRNGLLVAGTSLAFGAVAGFHGVEHARGWVKDFSPRRTFASAGETIGATYGRTKTKAAELFSSSRQAAGGLSQRLILGTREKAARNLRALGLQDETVKDLSLAAVKRDTVGYQAYEPTNMPGFEYSVVENWGGYGMGEERRIVFSVPAWYQARSGLVASRRLSQAEAEDIVRQIKLTPVQQGGKDFMVMMDETSGAITPTRLTTQDMKPRGRARSGKSIVEAKRDGDIPLGVPVASEAADDTASAGAKGYFASLNQSLRNGYNKSKAAASTAGSAAARQAKDVSAKVMPAVRNFDLPWGATVAAVSAVPLYGFFVQGYRQGRSFGEGHEALYLESLIPPDEVRRLTVLLKDPRDE